MKRMFTKALALTIALTFSCPAYAAGYYNTPAYNAAHQETAAVTSKPTAPSNMSANEAKPVVIDLCAPETTASAFTDSIAPSTIEKPDTKPGIIYIS